MDQIERIVYYETVLDKITGVNAVLEEALTAYQETIPLVRELDAYYGSEDWRRDFADDEAGKLPPSLKRGVLSEDAAFDALEDNRQLLIRILETAVHALKKQ